VAIRLVSPCSPSGGAPRRSRAPSTGAGFAEEDEQAEHEGQDAQGFGQSRAEDQVGELATGGRRVTRRALQEAREDGADADARADHAEGREARADVLSRFRFHLI
jgi:hypothetical protein